MGGGPRRKQTCRRSRLDQGASGGIGKRQPSRRPGTRGRAASSTLFHDAGRSASGALRGEGVSYSASRDSNGNCWPDDVAWVHPAAPSSDGQIFIRRAQGKLTTRDGDMEEGGRPTADPSFGCMAVASSINSHVVRVRLAVQRPDHGNRAISRDSATFGQGIVVVR